MKGIHVAQPGPPGAPAAVRAVPDGPAVVGDASVVAVGPEGSPLWLQRSVLAEGSSLSWERPHGEQAVHVVSGELVVEGRSAPAGGALVVEGAVRANATAPCRTEVVLVGRRGDRSGSGTAVHVVGPGGTHALEEPGRETRFFADSTCPTCSVTLFLTGRSDAYESAPHSHSADELIHVLSGEVHLGRTVLGPGATLAVAADRRYGFRSPGFRFLNYRPGPSVLTRAGGGPAIEEGPAAAGLRAVGDLR